MTMSELAFRKTKQQQQKQRRDKSSIDSLCRRLSLLLLLIVSLSFNGRQQRGGGSGGPLLGYCCCCGFFPVTLALQNLWNNNFPPNPLLKKKNPTTTTTPGDDSLLVALEDKLFHLIAKEGQRLSDSQEISMLVSELETKNPTLEPAIAPQVYGRWKLLYTTNTDTSSPIQRNAVNAQSFDIYQDIVVVDNNNKQQQQEEEEDKYSSPVLQVNQVVQFSDNIYLSVNALASTDAYPIKELTERKGTGKIFGVWNILGVSLVGEQAKPDTKKKYPKSRIDFVFDQGNFFVGKSIQIPYPVPFRWPIFRDAVKGWIDITYLSNRLRIARGNKGTTFVLKKEDK